ncbi:glycoside hydrolase family 127 protein [Paenibacillus sp. S3N08]|uniref:Glycoside hydrolase family 127 protein n=1 Tax=Paenibacillus agricola TaxID=2716264 RepID=A0ABX0JD70_9BACL|nr:glycoside hydrolase family 127 protein [Paenibacillus agricola]
MRTAKQKLSPVSWKEVTVNGGFWQEIQKINSTVTIPLQYIRMEERGGIEALKLNWKPGDSNKPHHFWDSDIGKWIEAAAYSLAKHSDPELEKKIDDLVDLIEAGQQEDGYFNTFYNLVDPGKRWTNLYYMHELYCAGHLAEGAVAYYLATGKKKLLDIICRFMDHIDSRFGPQTGKVHGYCGHPEIELALVKMYQVTGEERYLRLSKFFIDERGQQPYYFELESLSRGVNVEVKADRPRHLKHYLCCQGPFAQYQSHLPVREQDAPVGHAVRAMYLYAGMADVAAETGDHTLLDACEVLWKRLTEKQLYITGGIGQSSDGERFTFDYDLPNEITYNETCASIGLVFWAHRLLQFNGDGKYADVMERALYNGIMSGVNLEGDRFFYANYLSVYPDRFKYGSTLITERMAPTRQGWFEVACCPPNLARLVASIGQYMYSTSTDGIYVHLYNDNESKLDLIDNQVILTQKTEYPWDGHIGITVNPENDAEFMIALRRPGWCQNAEIKVNNAVIDVEVRKGYWIVNRLWKQGDVIEIILDMPVQRIETHPSVRTNTAKVALQRGPIVYCFEEIDNAKDLNDVSLVSDADISARYEEDLLGGVVTLETKGRRRDTSTWDGQLYQPVKSEKMDITIKAVPYFAWANRGPGEMVVWVKQEE